MWGIFGSISTIVSGNGIIMKSTGVYEISTSSPGEIEKILIKEGDLIKKGDLVATIKQPEKLLDIKLKKEALKLLKEEFNKIGFDNKEDIEEYLEITQKDKSKLENEIKYFKNKLINLEKKLESWKELYKQGLIIKQKILDINDEIQQTKVSIMESSNQLFVNKEQLDKKTQNSDEGKDNNNKKILNASLELRVLKKEYELAKEIRSSEDGRVYEIRVTVGDTVHEGQSLAALDSAGTGGGIEAIFFVSPMEGKLIEDGFEANVSPSTVKKEEFGFIKAKVNSVSVYPASSRMLMNLLDNEELVKSFLRDGTPIVVHATLKHDSQTFSKLAWSSSKGPRIFITSGTLCNVRVTVKKQAPITLVIAIFKKIVGI
ncbi:MAG: NHLP bacteriocin system secretion protein [Bacteroidales bacterium]|nr:NHLP bacteriocin system secretion protein [Bacteroidales bacterium]